MHLRTYVIFICDDRQFSFADIYLRFMFDIANFIIVTDYLAHLSLCESTCMHLNSYHAI